MMQATLLDFRVSEPSNGQPGGILPNGVALPANVPADNQPLELADLGLFLDTGIQTRVDLYLYVVIQNATDVGAQVLTIDFTRDNNPTPFWTTNVVLLSGQLVNLMLSGADFNVPAGFHVYKAVATGSTVPQFSGPLKFSGAAYALA